ncbi:hypothetical protein FDN13_02745 [Caloramator sp. E03]|uniref:CD1247 N-terminal domain-containing protein n=1 Tax=Caloramator sp. E03 TaxID=2576307 RepID=UPI0011109361|nr:CD1247 N-terminal domain-containing protein [Caloramator sp. E03]QCX32708.1 hypothetical protein FDN13_02745 [Caloramator sp. E03]
MESVKEKVAYLKGLMEGLDLDCSSKEGKLFKAIIETMDEMAEAIEILEENQNELDEYIDTMDQDLARLEDDVYEEDDDYDFEDEDEGYVEVECPNCHETVYLDEEMFNDDEEEIICPNCDKPIYFGCNCDDDNCKCKDK